MAKHQVICQKWEESERGWGVRPDGYSLHLNDIDAKRYLDAYWADMPDKAPVEYERPAGSSYKCIIDDETYQRLSASNGGIRIYSNVYPEGGIDGWMSMAEVGN